MPKRLFGKIDKQTTDAYILNVLQLASMGVNAFVVPLLIGIEEYGHFAALFALPATLSVFLQSFLASKMGTTTDAEFKGGSRLLLVLLWCIYLFLACLLVALPIALASTLILVCSSERLRQELLLLQHNRESYLRTLRKIEVISGALLVSGVAIAALEGFHTYLVPVVLVSVSMVCGIPLLIAKRPRYSAIPMTTSLQILKGGGLQGVLLRLHEELFITSMPMVIAAFLGEAVAGGFRVTMSVVKLVFKFSPFRFEKMIADSFHEPLQPRRVIWVVALGFVVSFAAIGCVFLGLRFWPQSQLLLAIDPYVLATAAFLSFLCTVWPVFVLRNPWFHAMSLACFVVTVGTLQTGNFEAFRSVYIVSQIIMAIFLFMMVVKQYSTRTAASPNPNETP